LKLVTHVLFLRSDHNESTGTVRTDRFEINFVDALTARLVISVVGKFGALEEIVVTFLRPLT
jgi:hypothetical protein